LDKHIRLLDSPGVLLATSNRMDVAEAALKNAVRVESLSDPVMPVAAILRRCPAQMLMLHYGIAEFTSCEGFLGLVARRSGRLKKGAKPDLNAAAKIVLNDWNTGRLRYYTEPPSSAQAEVDETNRLCSTQLLSQLSAEFQLNDVDDSTVLDDARSSQSSMDTAMHYQAVPLQEVDAEMAEVGEDEPATRVMIDEKQKKKKTGAEVDGGFDCRVPMPQSLQLDGNVQLNKAIKTSVKRGKRQARKQGKRAERLADVLQAASLDQQMDYDWTMGDTSGKS